MSRIVLLALLLIALPACPFFGGPDHPGSDEAWVEVSPTLEIAVGEELELRFVTGGPEAPNPLDVHVRSYGVFGTGEEPGFVQVVNDRCPVMNEDEACVVLRGETAGPAELTFTVRSWGQGAVMDQKVDVTVLPGE